MVIVSTKEQGKNVWNSIENLDGSVLSQFAFHFFSGSVQLGWKRGQDKKLSWTNFGTSVKQQLTHSSFIIRDFPLASRQKAPFIGIFLRQVYIRHWHYPKITRPSVSPWGHKKFSPLSCLMIGVITHLIDVIRFGRVFCIRFSLPRLLGRLFFHVNMLNCIILIRLSTSARTADNYKPGARF